MIVLDTNVLSELMEANPAPAMLAWLDQQPRGQLWTTTITIFELRWGIERLAAGARQEKLDREFDRLIDIKLKKRVLNFDREAAIKAAALMANRGNAGKPIDFRDVEIAGIVLARKAILATRNARHFKGTGVKVVNPWTS